MLNQKVLVIGLDGVSFDLIGPWLNDGHLPNIKRLIDEGSSAVLETVFPPITPAAWSSFFTGKNPGNHGLFNYEQRNSVDSKSIAPVNSHSIKSRTLWRILSDKALRVGVLNVPMTYPAEAVNGFLVCGLFTPSLDNFEGIDFTYPNQLRDELLREFGPYRIYPRLIYSKGNINRLLEEYYILLNQRLSSALYLMEKKPWDFFMVVINETDYIQHQLWHILDSQHHQYDPKESQIYKDGILRFFKEVDRAIGLIVEKAGPNTNIILMSDHGLGPVYKWIYLNNWLLKTGYLKIKRTLATQFKKFLFNLGITPANIYKFSLWFSKGRKKGGLDHKGRDLWLQKLFLSDDDIDWPRTTAYSLGHMGQVNINLRGREPRGSVPPALYNKIRDSISRDLLSMKDSKTGEKIVEKVFKKEEIYFGQHIDLASDLYIKTVKPQYQALGGASFIDNGIIARSYGNSATHRIKGIFAIKGPVIKRNVKLEGLKIYDIAPNILFLLGQQIPSDLDGKFIPSLFQEDFIMENSVRYEKAGPQQESERESKIPLLTKEEIAIGNEILKKLGYKK